MAAQTQIGTAYLAGTIVTKAGLLLANLEARFPGRGRLELQGVVPSSGAQTYVITGGTGVFAHASGKAVGRDNNVTVTFN
jgi:hypothetical protein